MDPIDRRTRLLRAVGPLRWIFWGGLLCLFDFSITSTSNGTGIRFDLLNDFLGMLLITAGVFRLGSIEIARSYTRAFGFVKAVAVVSAVEALFGHFVFERPAFVSFLSQVFALAELAAMLVFCLTMRLYCLAADLEASARSWKTTTTLFLVIYALPLGAFYLASAVAVATESSFNLDLGLAGLLLLPVFFAPLLHFFMSTSRMAREAERAAV